MSRRENAPADGAPYPFSVPQIRTLPPFDIRTNAAFFVGENGSGKSTLLEGIAAAVELLGPRFPAEAWFCTRTRPC